MFTGIVEEAGRVVEVLERAEGIRLRVASKVSGREARIGDSIAVNGCCLTVVESDTSILGFDLLKETWRRTNLHALLAGSLVNLERSMPANGRIHGHFVTGHVDGTGVIDVFEQRGTDWYLRIAPPLDLTRYIAFKGAIAVDGMSLTVAEVQEKSFAVWIIPHTYAVTVLRDRAKGSLVNLEADLLAKYVERLMAK